MAQTTGSRLTAYDVLEQLGAGGMGEVYRAKDTKLGRDVALKILPASFTSDPERIARFRREAQVLASLNHPHIAQIYGLEEANGTQFLVLELVDGESLDKRIARGPIPVDEAVGIAKQIAEALEAAHEKGIIHRDLKPANIALTKDGEVKVLDFGLAKAVEMTSGASADAMNSPTITSPAMMTGVGVILGTATYMSPEQAKGRAADKRSDIWAFGCVLYEMLTGKRAFEGEDVSDTLANVLKATPAWTLLPSKLSAPVRLLVERCLEKESSRRVGDLSVVRYVLSAPETEAVANRPSAVRLLSGVVAVAVLFSVVVFVIFELRRNTEAPRLIRLGLSLPAGLTIARGSASPAAISPDGTQIAVALFEPSGASRLWIRRLDSEDLQPLAGTDDGQNPFWSPDSEWVAFFSHNRLNKIRASGGQLQTICQASAGAGGTWSANGTIVFALGNLGGLWQVNADGGEPTAATRLNVEKQEVRHRQPSFLPDGTHFVYRAQDLGPLGTVQVGNTRDTTVTTLPISGDNAAPVYVTPGYLVWRRGSVLIAQQFDTQSLAVRGQPVRVANVGVTGTGREFDVTPTVIAHSDVAAGLSTLEWRDREGRAGGRIGEADGYSEPDLTPDERQVVVLIRDRAAEGGDIWRINVDDGRRSRMTTTGGLISGFRLSPDGREVALMLFKRGASGLYRQQFDSTLPAIKLVDGATGVVAASHWSAAQGTILWKANDPQTSDDIWALSLGSHATSVPLVRTPNREETGQLSPDGHWLAYASDESGPFEIYVQPYPADGRRWQVSHNGGSFPLWRGDGRELFFYTGSHIALATFAPGPTPMIGREQRLFATLVRSPQVNAYPYAITADGQRFLINTPVPNPTPISVVLNWTSMLPK